MHRCVIPHWGTGLREGAVSAQVCDPTLGNRAKGGGSECTGV